MSSLIPTVLKKTANGVAAFDIFSRLLEENIISIGNPITTELAEIVVASLKVLEAKDPTKTISIWIDSPGGDILAGYSIIDTMKCIKNPIQTVATGMVASMALSIFLNGDKGNRLVQEHAKLLAHQPSGGSHGQASQMEIDFNFIQGLKVELEDMYVSLTKCTKKKIHEMMDRDTWMNADEAIKLGFADKKIEPAKK